MKTIRALRGTTVALLVVAGALPAVQAQGIPSVEACMRSAAADAAYEAALEAARQQAFDAAEAARQQAYAAALEATRQQVLAALEATLQQVWADHEVALQTAEQALVAAYFAIYDIDGGARNEVPDVMGKLGRVDEFMES